MVTWSTRTRPHRSDSSGDPAAEGGDQQRDGAKHTGLAGGDLPQAEKAGDDEGKYLHVECIQGPAAKAGKHGPALARGQVGEPCEHDVVPVR